MRWTERQTWPACTNAPRAVRVAAYSRSAPSSTMSPPLPPSSSATRLVPAIALSAHPTCALPVKLTILIRSSTARRSATGGSSEMTLSAPLGSPASAANSASITAGPGHCGGGLKTIVLPVAMAGGDLVRDQVERKVERRNRGDWADRETLDDSDRALVCGLKVDRFGALPEAFDLLGGEREDADGAADLGASVIDRLAGAERDRAFEVAAPFGHPAAHRAQNFGALRAPEAAGLFIGARRT